MAHDGGSTISLEEARRKRRSRAGGSFGDAVDELNRDFALLLHGGHSVIMREVIGPTGRPRLDFITVAAFKQFLANRQISTGDGSVPIANVWLKSPERRSYTDIVFAPEGAPAGVYNLWRGFAIAPKAGDCSLFLDHLYHVVCGENAPLYDWVLAWFAHLVQNPTEKPGTAIAFRGEEGAGKDLVGEMFGSLLGRHYFQVADARYVTGHFNSHLADCLLLQADEAFWAGDKAALGALKNLITAPALAIEWKGREPIPVRNCTRLLITSNERWVIPAAMRQRRFAILDVSDERVGDHAYFARIHAQMDAGGRAALLKTLLDLDISAINLRVAPTTAALADQKIRSLEPEERWWFECLSAGEINRDHEWPESVDCARLVDAYVGWSERHNVRRRAAETEIGAMLRAFVPSIVRRRSVRRTDGSRPWIYVLPSLDECRKDFCERLGIAHPWEPEEPM